MLKLITHNWMLKLVSLGVALAIWLFVVGQEKSEMTLRVPLEMRNIPVGLMVQDTDSLDLEVRVLGPMNLIRRASNLHLSKIINLDGLGPGEHDFPVRPEDLSMPSGLQVVRVTPPMVQVSLAQILVRMLPVRPIIKGQPDPSVELVEVTFSPEKVRVSGPSQFVEEMDWVWTAPIDLEGWKSSFTETVLLRWQRGLDVHMQPSQVQATVTLAPADKKESGPESRDKK